jgi:hypothetical protein
MMMAAALAITVILGAVGSATERLSTALQEIAAGRYADAARALEQLSRDAPDADEADDALMKAAELHDRQLNDPVRAVALYREVAVRFPTSRLARRAARRADELEHALGAGARFEAEVARFEDALARAGATPSDDTIAGIEALLAASPDLPIGARVAMWIGRAHLAHGRLDTSLAWFERAPGYAGGAALVWHARKAEADALLAGGRLDDAERAYRALGGTDDAARRGAAVIGLERVERARVWNTLARWAWLAVVLFAAAMVVSCRRVTGSWRAAARALRKPPVEVIYLVPLALAISIGSFRTNVLAARAIVLIFCGGLITTWVSGAVLVSAQARFGTVSARRALLHAGGAAVVVAAICYIAVMREQLLGMLTETVRHGPEQP